MATAGPDEGASALPHDPGVFVESLRGENDERVHVLHLAAGLRIAINPDHVTPIRAP